MPSSALPLFFSRGPVEPNADREREFKGNGKFAGRKTRWISIPRVWRLTSESACVFDEQEGNSGARRGEFEWEREKKDRHREVNSVGSPGTAAEAGEKLWRLRRRNSVDCRGFMYAACIRARAQRDLSALGRVSVGQVEWIVNVSGRTSPRWRPPPGASLFTPHGSPRGKSSMARVEHSNPAESTGRFTALFSTRHPRNLVESALHFRRRFSCPPCEFSVAPSRLFSPSDKTFRELLWY